MDIYFVIFIIIILFYLILRNPKPVHRQHIHIQPPDNNTKLNQTYDSQSKEIDKFFKMPTPCIPIDYPVKKIGDCPYSKAESMDLPIAQIPMCFADKLDNNMYLRIKNDNISK